MLDKHHSLTIDATYDLLDFWKENEEPELASLVDIGKIKAVTLGRGIGGLKIKRKDLRRWVAQADYIEDVDLPAELTEFIINVFSNPTRFQHFAYCDSDEHEGYCWDCDPSLSDFFKVSANHLFIRAIRRIIPIGKISVIRKYLGQKVEYSSYLYPLSEDFFKKSYGYKDIKGDTAWHDQKYPSAIKMAEFYGDDAGNFKNSGRADWAIKSLGFAIHMLQDLGVYHHVFCKLLDGHSSFEKESLDLWKEYYADKEEPEKDKILKDEVNQKVLESLKEVEDVGKVDSFEKLGKRLVAITGKQFQGIRTFDEIKKKKKAHEIKKKKKAMAIEMTVQGIACTIKAISLFV